MSVTPMKFKTVSFQLPGTVQPRAATAPPRVRTVRQPGTSSRKIIPHGASGKHRREGVTSPKPDLIADIFHDQEIKQKATSERSDETPNRPKSAVPSHSSPTNEVVPMHEVLSHEHEVSEDQVNEERRSSSSSGQSKVSKAKVIKSTHKALTPVRRLTPTNLVTKMASQIRDQTNTASFDYMRWLKHDVAKLREHLVKIEEEIKLASKAKAVLDTRILDVRKCLSVNQQSISAQQKKSHKEDTVSRRLREETHVLSRVKRKLEQHLVQMKSHLWNLDCMRKTVKSKISILSRALELDAQRMKVYHGPVVTRPESVSKHKHYTHACPLPKNTAGDEAIAQLCNKVMEMIGTSKSLRSDMKALIQYAYTSKAEAHEKIMSAVSKTVVGTQAHQNDLMLQKGRVKMQKHTLSHQTHINEIALGVALGPHSEQFRSVSERPERPLSRVRPGSAAVESMCTKYVANQITRQLSASAGRVSRLANSDITLGKGIHEDGRDTGIDSRMMRSRRAFLSDKRH